MRKKLKAITIQSSKKYKIALIVSRYHQDLNNKMALACKEVLIQAGIPEKNIETLYAPGAWEIPLIAEYAADSEKYDALATFGTLIKGETYHFDMIANECGRVLMEISLLYKIPVALEVLAVYSVTQAKKRVTGEHNKGIEAANAILQTLETIQKI